MVWFLIFYHAEKYSPNWIDTYLHIHMYFKLSLVLIEVPVHVQCRGVGHLLKLRLFLLFFSFFFAFVHVLAIFYVLARISNKTKDIYNETKSKLEKLPILKKVLSYRNCPLNWDLCISISHFTVICYLNGVSMHTGTMETSLTALCMLTKTS